MAAEVEASGASLRVASRWLNAVSVEATPQQIADVAAFMTALPKLIEDLDLVSREGLIGVGLVNALPVAGSLSGARLQALYGVALQDPNIVILMRHRAVLFGIVGGLLVGAAFHAPLRGAAYGAGFVSMLSFVLIAWLVGGYNAELRRVVIVDLIGFGIVMPILPFWATELGASSTTYGLVLSSYAAAQFLCSPLWGALSDRVGRRRVLLMTVAGTALAFMGATYYLIPLIFRKRLAFWGMARIQPYLFAIGMVIFTMSMTFAGSFGVPRRHWDISFSQAPFDLQFSPAVDLLLALTALAALAALGVLLLTEIADFNAAFGTSFSDEEFDTIGGLVMQRFGRVPKRGEQLAIDALNFRVLRADSRRIYLLQVAKKLDKPPA